MRLADRIRYAIELRGSNPRDAARRCGLSDNTVHMTLKRLDSAGGGTVTVATIEALARGLDVDPSWLAWGTGTATPEADPDAPQTWVDHRYPNRAHAARFAEVCGVSHDAIRRVMHGDPQTDHDRSALDWLADMQALDRHMRLAALTGAGDLSPPPPPVSGAHDPDGDSDAPASDPFSETA